MAATENQALMVLKEEGATAPATTPTPTAAAPLAFFVILKPGHASDGGQDQGILVTNQEANMATASSQAVPVAGQPTRTSSLLSDSYSPAAEPHPENLPPESVCKGMRVTLDNNNMWNEFYRCRTEMILTKQGRRMFPYCRFRISGMEPFQRYILVMDITPMDNLRYKWNGRQWEPNGKAEPHVLGRVFIHPDSPSSGHYWMQNPVSFYKLKLTNNTLDQEGHVILHSMHRYLPRLHVVPADKATEVIRLNGPDVLTFTFPQTEFFAVTAYQNLRITQLKIDYNPFAKGFRDEGSCGRLKADSLEADLELSRPAVGVAEEKPLKVDLPHLKNNNDFDSFVIDKELFHPEYPDAGCHDKGSSSPPRAVSADKDHSRRKRARAPPSSEAGLAARSKVRRSVSKKKDKSGASERSSSAGVTVKEEEEEVEVFNDVTAPQLLDCFSEVPGVQLEGPGDGKPVMPEKTASNGSPGASSQEPTLSPNSVNSVRDTDNSSGFFLKGLAPTKQHEATPLPQLAQFLKERKLTPRSKSKMTEVSQSMLKPTSAPLSSASPPLPPEPTPNSSKPSSPIPNGAEDPGVSQENLEAASHPSGGLQADTQSSLVKKKRKSTARCRKHGKFVKRPEAVGGPTDVSMQPNLEDVEGLLFVSFTSKEALEIHLGDQSLNRETPPQPQEVQEPPEEHDFLSPCEESETTVEKIARLEEALLHDLKRIRHRQVIHPVLQEVGLKLNLLDQTLTIDLQYLGVCLPLPPPFCPREDGISAFLTSSPDGLFPFVSRTGKTTDYTKIKGWRDKFNITPDASSSKAEGIGASSDATLKNRSAFCSDMLDEYLAIEGKLIDERTTSFSQSADSSVVYQLPTKSTSYVRTLDSVLKKQSPSPVAPRHSLKPVPPPKKSRMSQRARTPARSKYSPSEVKSKPGPQTSMVTSLSNKNPSGGPKLSTKTKASPKTLRSPTTGRPMSTMLCPKASPTAQSKAAPGALPEKVNVWQDSNLVNQGSTGMAARGPGLSKTLLKLMDLEDGAVWEGKERTCVTEDRASVALAALLTAQGSLKGSKVTSRVIKRRAPPCLNDFCRLGCVCSSLVQQRRRFTHCGKPECMFGCTCLKRRVVLVKTPPSPPSKKKLDQGDLIFYDALEEEAQTKLKRKKRRRMAYTAISESERESEPAARVQTLWNPKVEEIDPEPLYAPTPVYFPWSQVMIRLESLSVVVPKEVREEEKDPVYRYFESMMTCARVRPFSSKSPALAVAGMHKLKQEDDHSNANLVHKTGKDQQKAAESQQTVFRPEPAKRLEIVSECAWEKKMDRNRVLRVVCEYMAQNRLSHPFHVGRYLIKPVSQSHQKDGQNTTVTYKVSISQLRDSDPALQDEDWYAELSSRPTSRGAGRAEGEEPPAVSRSRILPFLTRVSPAGLLTANRRQPGVSAQGLIKVNGKSYPQAKLQLGQMGALHPANRLAAYITGRLRPTERRPSATASSAAVSLARPPSLNLSDTSFTLQLARLPASSLSSTTTTTTTTTVTGAGPTVAAVLKNLDETSPLKGPVPKSPSSAAAGPRMLLIPISQASPAVRPVTPATITQGQKMVLQPVRGASGTHFFRHPSGQLVQLVPLSQLRAVQPNLVIRSPGAVVRLPAPSTTVSNSVLSSTSTQKSPLATAATVTKVLTATTPPPSVTKSPGGTVVTSAVPVPLTSLTESPTCSSAVLTKTTTTVTTSPTSLSGATAFTLSSLTPSLKTVPGFLGQTGTYTVRIAPSSRESKVITLNAAGPLPASPELLPGQSGFTLLQIPKSPIGRVVITPAKTDMVPAKNSSNTSCSNGQIAQTCSDADPSQSSPGRPTCTDHSYTTGPESSNELKAGGGDGSNTVDSALEKPGTPSSSTGVSLKAAETILTLSPPAKVSLQPPSVMVPLLNISEVISVVSAAEKRSRREPGSESCSGTAVATPPARSSEASLVKQDETLKPSQEKRLLEEGEVEVEVDLEVPGESEDLSDDSDEESEDESIGLVGDPEDTEEDEAVDIETVEELSEKINIARMKAAAMQMKLNKVLTHEAEKTETKQPGQQQQELTLEEVVTVAGRIHHNVTERRRRTELRGLFEKLKHTLGLQHMPKASKFFILKQANSEIQALVDQNDRLEENKRMLNRQRAAYIKKISQTSGKSEELIIKKLQDICAKQKSLEAQRKKKAGVSADSNPKKLQPLPPASVGSLSNACSSPRRPNILSRKKRQGSESAGVASVTINVPGVSLPIQVKSPLPDSPLSLSAQSASQKTSSEARRNVTIAKTVNVKSVQSSPQRSEKQDQSSLEATQPLSSCQGSGPGFSGDLEGASHEKQGLEDGEVIGDHLSCNQPRDPAEQIRDNGLDTASQEEEDDEDDIDDNPEDERLTSLLNEIAFLNQQMNSEEADSAQRYTQKARHTLLGEPVDGAKGQEGDDERSLSPLFLQLDEDLLAPTEDRVEEKLVRAGAGESLRVLFRPTHQLELAKCATVANGVRQKSPPSSVKGGALTPPPLLQMKAGNVTMSAGLRSKGGEVEGEVSWRPMPRLAPLGRKMSTPPQDIAASGTKSPADPLSQHKDDTQNTT